MIEWFYVFFHHLCKNITDSANRWTNYRGQKAVVCIWRYLVLQNTSSDMEAIAKFNINSSNFYLSLLPDLHSLMPNFYYFLSLPDILLLFWLSLIWNGYKRLFSLSRAHIVFYSTTRFLPINLVSIIRPGLFSSILLRQIEVTFKNYQIIA